jgi:hypothetical protein
MTGKSPRDCDAPKWARFKARDESGEWYWYECRPNYYKKTGQWSAARGQCERVENWQSGATAESANKVNGTEAISEIQGRSGTAPTESAAAAAKATGT